MANICKYKMVNKSRDHLWKNGMNSETIYGCQRSEGSFIVQAIVITQINVI